MEHRAIGGSGRLAAALAFSLILGGAIQAQNGPAPSYEEVVAMAARGHYPTPSPLAYRLVLRFADPTSFALPGAFEFLLRQADLSLRFGLSMQEAGLRLRQNSLIALNQGALASGMARLQREEAWKRRLGPLIRGGAERGAGRLGAGGLGASPGWLPPAGPGGGLSGPFDRPGGSGTKSGGG